MADRIEITIDRHVAAVELNRPEKRNAVDLDMFRSLVEAGDQIAADASVRAVVLSGRGGCFSAGIDTSLFTSGDLSTIAEDMRPLAPSPANLFQRAAYVWQELPVPVICAIEGVAFGAGLQIALGADMRYATPSARLGVMEVNWGLIPDMAISVTAAGLVRQDVLRELAFTGRVIEAGEAASLGLVTRVAEDAVAEAHETAVSIAARSPNAVRSMKRLFRETQDLDVQGALALEAKLQSALLGSPDQLEAVAAAREKRRPEFGN